MHCDVVIDELVRDGGPSIRTSLPAGLVEGLAQCALHLADAASCSVGGQSGGACASSCSARPGIPAAARYMRESESLVRAFHDRRRRGIHRKSGYPSGYQACYSGERPSKIRRLSRHVADDR